MANDRPMQVILAKIREERKKVRALRPPDESNMHPRSDPFATPNSLL